MWFFRGTEVFVEVTVFFKKHWKKVFIYSVGKVASKCRKIISSLLWIIHKVALKCSANCGWFILHTGHIQNSHTSLPAASGGWWLPGVHTVGQGRAWDCWGSPRHQASPWARDGLRLGWDVSCECAWLSRAMSGQGRAVGSPWVVRDSWGWCCPWGHNMNLAT